MGHRKDVQTVLFRILRDVLDQVMNNQKTKEKLLGFIVFSVLALNFECRGNGLSVTCHQSNRVVIVSAEETSGGVISGTPNPFLKSF